MVTLFFIFATIGAVTSDTCSTVGKIHREALSDKCSDVDFDQLLQVC